MVQYHCAFIRTIIPINSCGKFCMQGLITKERKNLDPAAAPFARNLREIEGLREGANLVEVVSPAG